MSKLIDRMSLPNKEILMESANKFPHTFKPVFEELETKGFWTSLTYETVSVLVSHLNLKGYDPCYISEVFEK
jgi:predicted transcriptional regulator